jgi:hypothetical protein
MFEEILFPRTAERYRAVPLVEQRERYLIHLKETGARRPTLRKCANDQLSLVRLLKLKEGGRVRVSQIDAATAICEGQGRRPLRGRSATAKSFMEGGQGSHGLPEILVSQELCCGVLRRVLLL